MAKADALALARDIPPPGKLKKAEPYGGDEETTPAPEPDEEGDKATAVSMMQEFIDAVKDGDAEAACTAFDNYADSRTGK